MDIPDIVGMELKRAAAILESKGITISDVKVTVSPLCKDNSCRDGNYKDYFRIIRVEGIDENKVEILACNPFCNLST
ncbi:MAG: hypothetical protein GX754_13175 [Clostridiaceae bacterium]|nr:hypothetical protein [Clostridiaceae bacterium]